MTRSVPPLADGSSDSSISIEADAVVKVPKKREAGELSDEELGAMGSHGKSLTKVCRNVSAAIWEAGPRLSRQVAFSKRFAQCLVHTYLGVEPGGEIFRIGLQAAFSPLLLPTF